MERNITHVFRSINSRQLGLLNGVTGGKLHLGSRGAFVYPDRKFTTNRKLLVSVYATGSVGVRLGR
jgi:hypothetical protein